MPQTNEAFSRVRVDTKPKDLGWATENANAARCDEVVAPDDTEIVERDDQTACMAHDGGLELIEAN